MAINTTSETTEFRDAGAYQTYQDLTFVLGPPSGERYEALTTIARRSGESFSTTYGLFIAFSFSGRLR